MRIPFHKVGKNFFVATSIIFLLLIIIKAVYAGITYDEAYSFLHHARSSLSDIFLYTGALPANNHILNTLSMKLFAGVFGVHEGIVRLGSMIGTLIYLWGAYRLTAYFAKNKAIIRYVAPIIFFANPFVFDFLMAARGYSLAMAFMILGFSFFLPAFFEKYTKKNFHAFLICFFLMTVSNLSFLNVFLAVGGTYGILTLWEAYRDGKYNHIRKRYGIMLVYTIVLGLLYIVPISSMYRQDDLRFGGTRGLFSDTYLSLVKSFMYESTNYILQVSIIIICIIILAAALWFTIQYFFKRKEIYGKVAVVSLLFFLASLSIVMQHRILGTAFVIQRTAIFFFILFGLIVISLLQIADKKTYPIFIAGACLTLIHFITQLNFTHIPQWSFDAPTKEMIHTLSQKAKTENKNITLGIDRVNEPALEFYMLKDDITNIDHFIVGNNDQTADYYYVYDVTYKGYLNTPLAPRMKLLRKYPKTDMVLFTLN